MLFLASIQLFTALIFLHYQFKPIGGFSLGVGTKIQERIGWILPFKRISIFSKRLVF
jgi:hypothetical protein